MHSTNLIHHLHAVNAYQIYKTKLSYLNWDEYKRE